MEDKGAEQIARSHPGAQRAPPGGQRAESLVGCAGLLATMKSRLMVVDTETGGLRADRHALLSVAAVDSTSGEAYHAFIRPSAEWLVESEALAINGLSLEHLREVGRPEGIFYPPTAWTKA